MCKVQNRFKDLMHFFRRISVKNITNQYINDWVKGLRICSSCDRARHVVLGKGSQDLLCMHAGTNRGPGGMPGDTAGGMRGVPLAVLWIPRAAVNICEAVAGDPSRPP